MNTLNRAAIRILLLTALSSTAGIALAQPPQEPPPGDQPPDQQGRHHHGPPPEALDACKSAASGQQCSFTSPRGDQISGTCVARDEGKPLACRPAHRPGADPSGAQPPKE